MPKSAKLVAAAIVVVLMAALVVGMELGCGSASETTSIGGPTGKPVTTAGNGGGKGKLYVAVTGTADLQAGSGDMGMAIIDLATKQVEMVNIPEAKAPHGIIFPTDTKTASNTRGRVALEQPSSIYLGNAQDGSVLVVDLSTNKVTKSIMPPPDAKLAICAMQVGPDGRIYLASMADGKVYPFQNDTIMSPGIGGAGATTSICGIAWSAGGQFAYLSNMFNPQDPNEAGYIAKLNWPSGTLVSKIQNVTNPSPSGGYMAREIEVTPDGKYMYLADGADGSLVKIDMATETVIKRVPIGGEPHSIVFSSDGSTAYISVRHMPVEDGSSIIVYDVAKDQVIDRIPGIPAPLVGGLVLQESAS